MPKRKIDLPVPLKDDPKTGTSTVYEKGEAIPVIYGGTGRTGFSNDRNPVNPTGQVVGNNDKPLQLLKCVYDGTRDPDGNIDNLRSYFNVGSRWINTTNDTEWVCVDRGSNARPAVWIQTATADSEFGDTFRYYGSLVDFRYDYQHYTWERVNSKNVVRVEYEYESESVGIMTITYNDDNQPELITMTYADASVKTITLDYDDDGYLDTMTRA